MLNKSRKDRSIRGSLYRMDILCSFRLTCLLSGQCHSNCSEAHFLSVESHSRRAHLGAQYPVSLPCRLWPVLLGARGIWISSFSLFCSVSYPLPGVVLTSYLSACLGFLLEDLSLSGVSYFRFVDFLPTLSCKLQVERGRFAGCTDILQQS